MADDHIVVVIPALDEEQTIGEVVSEFRRVVDEVVVVDDGSTDETASVARSEGATVLSHDTNLGYDRSIEDGFQRAVETGATVVVTADADGQHRDEHLETVVEPVLTGDTDVVVGERVDRARLVEALFALYTKPRFGVDDPFSGLKAYDADVYRTVGYFDEITSIGTQILICADNAGYDISQEPITVTEREDQSRFGPSLTANWNFLKSALRVVWFDVRS